MKKSWFIVLFFLAIIGLLSYVTFKEGFGATQPGTLVQLAAGHVPSEEDEREAREWKGQVKRDLVALTGSA